MNALVGQIVIAGIIAVGIYFLLTRLTVKANETKYSATEKETDENE